MTQPIKPEDKVRVFFKSQLRDGPASHVMKPDEAEDYIRKLRAEQRSKGGVHGTYYPVAVLPRTR